MNHRLLLGAPTLCAALAAIPAEAGQANARGFIEDAHLDLLNRNYYFIRDFRNGAANGLGTNAGRPLSERNGYREEWAHGIMAYYRSGFTQGTLGAGLDAHAMLGLKLDSGGGRTGTSLLPVDRDGQPRDDYSTLGGALKLRLSGTVLKYGEMIPEVPVFAANQARLLPSMATGFSLVSDEVAALNLQAGHFTRTRGVDSSNSDGELTTDYAVLPAARSISYLGGTWTQGGDFSLSLYSSALEDIWRQHYAGAKYRIGLAQGQALSFAFNLYDTHDSGSAKGGEIDTTAWSLTATYVLGPHSFTLGRQVVDGDEPLDWVGFDRTQGGSLFMGNVAQVVTFSEANERSWQLRYDLDMAAFGVPGLTLMTRYIRGDGMDNADSDNPFYTTRFRYDPAKDNKHWERNVDVRYVVQGGPAKNLSLRLRQSTHRATTGYRYPDHDEVRVIVEYPLSLF